MKKVFFWSVEKQVMAEYNENLVRDIFYVKLN